MTIRPAAGYGTVAVLIAFAAAADAQVIGTFSWQTQPHCNVVTVTVVQQGGVYLLSGADNLCGAGTAPITGTAVPAGGNVVFGFTAALPTGLSAHVSATITLASLSGTWSDADGNTGPFVFGGGVAGAPRPAPTASTAITVAQFSPTVYGGTGVAMTVARSDHIHDDRYYTEAETNALLATKAGTLEVLVTAGSILTFVPEANFGFVRSFTSTKPGRLDMQMFFGLSAVTCTSGTPWAYLLVDNTPVPSSAYPLSASAPTLVQMRGVTTDVVASGTHGFGVALECTGAGVPGAISASFPGAAAIVVFP